MERLGVNKSEQKKRQFLNRLSSEITKRGIIDVLRNGVKAYPADLIMFYFTPTENNARSKVLFAKNIFSVTVNCTILWMLLSLHLICVSS